MKMKIMEQEFNFDEYRAVFLKDKDEKIISVSFPIEAFYEFVEDLEDTADLRAYEDEGVNRKTVPHEDVVKELGLTPERIKEIRKDIGLTQAEFGEKIGYASGTIRNIETGQNKITPRVQRAIESLGY